MYKIHFPLIPNMGDLLNRYMLEDLFHIEVEAVSPMRSNVSAIGSGLDGTFYSSNRKKRWKQILYRPFMDPVHYVWGSGFLNKHQLDNARFMYKSVEFCSLRGQLSQAHVEQVLGKSLDVPLGDGGLLAERWVGPVEKQYQIGIIPHFKEQDHPLIQEMKAYYGAECTVIDLRENPKEAVRNIAQCETILSSSLHGLIVADSYHIPNLHIKLFEYGERIMGDGFKFADYYSSYGMNDKPFFIESASLPGPSDIKKYYSVDEDKVERNKEQIFEVFPVL